MKQQGHETEGVKSRSKGTFYPFVFTGKERDYETGYGYFGARYMDHELMTMWLSVDPMSDKYPGISPYAYCAWNPVKLVDPDGKELDWPQRRAAIAKAKEYEMANRINPLIPSGRGNSKNTYRIGAKGGPGQDVDCSGLTSACIQAGGEPDPVGKYLGGGVQQTVYGYELVSDMNLVEEGNLIVFNNQTHIGIITDVNHNDQGEIVSFTIIHSSGSKSRGFSGPHFENIPINGTKDWQIDGIYKWDTIPDKVIELPEVAIIANRNE